MTRFIRHLPLSSLLVLTLSLALTPILLADPKPTPAQTKFFETKVRPILVNACHECHAGSNPKGGLKLNSRANLLLGGDQGRVIVPGNPAASRLIQAINYNRTDLLMPPKKKLDPASIATLTQWVKMGAPWPGSTNTPIRKPQQQFNPAKERAAHWAFQPVTNPKPPTVKDPSKVFNPIDAFTLARLQSAGITPSPLASKQTLVRRAYFDLLGLPPSYEAVQQFTANNAPDAWPKLIDQLLANKQYGVRWARYWLDVARYADTKGYVFTQDPKYPYAYTYRDYVVRAFNNDLPYNQFVLEQLAADKLKLTADKRPLTAMGFLTVGRRFSNRIHDIIDDRIDVVTRGFMGLTVSCARCHDHKFDPISIKDYYGFYGIFASSHEPKDLPLVNDPKPTPEYLRYKTTLDKHLKAVTDYDQKVVNNVTHEARSRVTDYLLYLAQRKNINAQGIRGKRGEMRRAVLKRWAKYLASTKDAHPVWGILHKFNKYDKKSFTQKVQNAWRDLDKLIKQHGKNPFNPKVTAALRAAKINSLEDVANTYGNLLENAYNAWTKAGKPESGLPDKHTNQLLQILLQPAGPTTFTLADANSLRNRQERDSRRRLENRVNKHKATSPHAPIRAMVMNDRPKPITPRIFRRGNPASPGPTTQRQFFRLFDNINPKPFTNGSGRLELAHAIIHPKNPLTARVIVNRVWRWHFGKGLVATPSDFGKQATPPSHPKLLDYLASRFIRDGWSLKKLHRLIMTSRTYQQQSITRSAPQKLDPENNLLWRFNRRRLHFEAMRDSLLAAANRLDLTIGGKSVKLTTKPYTRRRAAYGYVDRQDLPGLHRTFDFASPDASSPGRPKTTVPQQALFMLNAPFVIEQAAAVVQNLDNAKISSPTKRIRKIYQNLYSRNPSPSELALALRFLNQPSKPEKHKALVWQYGYGKYNTKTRRVTAFTHLPYFSGNQWQGGPAVPDKKLQWALLNSTGGHVGFDGNHMVIRRWIAPASGLIQITGALAHQTTQGDGVEAWVVSSRTGPKAHYIAHNKQVQTPIKKFLVKRGETIDFVVNRRTSHFHDSFRWAPSVRMVRLADAGISLPKTTWNAEKDFNGLHAKRSQKLNPWIRYTQALMLANEMLFVD